MGQRQIGSTVPVSNLNTLSWLSSTKSQPTPDPCESAQAWDYEGHRTVNQLAISSLPTNFPAFAMTSEARERIAFLAGEADRWRNYTNDLSLSHCSGPDHYLDMEEMEDYGLNPATLPPFRYDLVAILALSRATHPEKFEPIDPAKNADHTRELIGFAPWAITENCGKLRSGFSYLKAFQNYGGTPEEILSTPNDFYLSMGLDDLVTPLRMRGMSGMLARVKRRVAAGITTG
jgi:hypothetical protein